MKGLRVAFIVMILVVVAVMTTIFYRNFNLVVPKESVKELLDPSAEFSLKNPHFVETSGDKIVFEVDADKAFYYQDDKKVKLENPKAILYGASGERTEVTASKGIIDSETNDIQVNEDVRLISPDGYLLITESLSYNKKKQEIASKGPVELIGDGFKVKGVGLRVKVDKERFTIYRKVEAVFESGFKGGPFAGSKK